jgi:hypothetical protein
MNSGVMKSVNRYQEIVGRNTDIKGSASRGPEGSEKHGRESLCHPGEHLSYHKWNVSRSVHAESTDGEGSEGKRRPTYWKLKRRLSLFSDTKLR